jgi:hypothetical protein
MAFSSKTRWRVTLTRQSQLNFAEAAENGFMLLL